MKDQNKSKQQLITELEDLRGRVNSLEAAAAAGKGTNEELRHEHDLAQKYLDVAGVIMVVLGKDGNIRLLNPKGYSVLGYDEGELLGKNWFDTCLPQGIRDEVKCAFRELLAGKMASTEYCDNPVITKSGEERSIAWHNAVLTDDAGAVVGTLSSGLDITERKHAEERLHSSERTLRMLIDASPESILLADHTTTILLANRTAADRLGKPVEQIVGRKPHDVLPAEIADHRLRHLEEVVRTGKPVRFDDVRSGRHIENMMQPILDDQGKVALVALLGIDQTDRKRAEEALKKAHNELEERVRERTAELSATAKQLQGEIEERRRVQEALRHSHDELQGIYENMADGLLLGDCATGRLLRTNPVMCRMLGYSADELLSMSVKDIHPADVVPKVMERFRTQQEGQMLLSQNRPMLKKDGTVFYADISNVRISYQGQPCVIGIFRDITERKQTEEALQASEERYDLAVRGAGVGIWDWDILTGNLYFSPGWNKLFGYEENEIGNSLEDWARLVHPDDHDRVVTFLNDFLASTSPTVTVEYRLRHKEGSYRWIVANAIVVRDEQGKTCRLVGSHGDITDRKKAEEALRQSHNELQAIYDGMRDGLLIADSETKRFVWANPAICSMLRCSKEEVNKLSVLDIHPSEEVPAVLEKFQAFVDGKAQIFEDIPVLRKDGSVFFADITHNEINLNGRPCSAGCFRDVSERKKAQEAVMRQKELEASEKFARQRAEELAEADRRKDEFLAMLAHELRNPLSPIRNGIDVLRIVPPGSEQASRIMDTMEQQADHLVRLVDDLLDVSRVTRGKLELKRERVALSKIITTATQTAEPLILSNGHELSLRQSRQDIHVFGDPTRLAQVVANLLNNAAKYTPPCGKILLTTDKIGDEVAIRVKDNGIGIAPDVLPHIFETFFQADGSLSRKHGGLGLGLTLVKNLVEMHGGTIEAQSERLGNGSEFTVRLPILQSSEIVSDEETVFPVETKSYTCHKIVVVDDVLPAAMIVGTLLESFGQQVRAAGSGAEALSMMKQEKPDIVLSDISMPEMNGYELAQAIRRNPEWQDVFLVALTGYGQESDKREAKEAGFDTHLVKPVDKGDLERLLMSWHYLR